MKSYKDMYYNTCTIDNTIINKREIIVRQANLDRWMVICLRCNNNDLIICCILYTISTTFLLLFYINNLKDISTLM